MLGIVSNLLTKNPADRALHRFLVLETAGEVVGAAVRTPPYPWVVTDLPEEFLPLLAVEIADKYPDSPGVGGPRSTAFPLAREIASRLGKKEALEMAMGIHQLEEVLPVPPARGRMRAAEPGDVALLIRWTQAFNEEIGESRVDPRVFVEGHLAHQRLFVWEDGKPVSMAAFGGNTPHGARVYGVFTPVELRRLGYATNLTAALSRRILGSGRDYCFLFTDMANPTSNHIYHKMGYRQVGDWDQYRFQ
jgi:predicted GNAT family acetyltransferase